VREEGALEDGRYKTRIQIRRNDKKQTKEIGIYSSSVGDEVVEWVGATCVLKVEIFAG